MGLSPHSDPWSDCVTPHNRRWARPSCCSGLPHTQAGATGRISRVVRLRPSSKICRLGPHFSPKARRKRGGRSPAVTKRSRLALADGTTMEKGIAHRTHLAASRHRSPSLYSKNLREAKTAQ